MAIRRIVTGHNAAGKSVFIIDGASPHVFQRNTGSASMSTKATVHGASVRLLQA